MIDVEIVSATRSTESDFWSAAPLAESLRRLAFDKRITVRLAFENRRGLPEIYNARIDADDSPDVLVFVHDDVWIDDHFLADRAIEALQDYDVVGVAGNRRRLPRQPSWAFVDTRFTWDAAPNLSGAVAHGDQPLGPVSFFGQTPASCELLDGVLLAVDKAMLKERKVGFDERFAFHFYDVDFCRTARARGLALGTYPICVTHRSGGSFGSEAWKHAYEVYLNKWGE